MHLDRDYYLRSHSLTSVFCSLYTEKKGICGWLDSWVVNLAASMSHKSRTLGLNCQVKCSEFVFIPGLQKT